MIHLTNSEYNVDHTENGAAFKDQVNRVKVNLVNCIELVCVDEGEFELCS